jgi:predicted 2-oxoglutarate/Fe(II)-dependent dioxygenase YbiX
MQTNVLTDEEVSALLEAADYEIKNNMCTVVPAYQSYANMHEVYKDLPSWQKLKKSVLQFAEDKFDDKFKIKASWFNVCKEDSNFDFHSHSEPTVVYYLSNCTDSGTLFIEDGKVISKECCDNSMDVIANEVEHSVPPWNGKDRYSVAFTLEKNVVCESINSLDSQGYIHLKDFLDKENCDQLVVELRKLIEEGKTTNDNQCPLSQAIHGAPVFDSLLEQLTPHFEKASGRKLFPTYAYARLYVPDDELKVHTDRPSCEISATLTLGFEGNVWPIYMGDEGGVNASKIEMNVGDAVLYKGIDKHHWREPYKEGKWQAQVFLHYVDADGPHAEWKYDKRSKLSHHTEPDYTCWHFPDAMTTDACKKLIDSIESQVQGDNARIGMGTNGIVNREIRDVKRVTLPSYRGIGATMAGMGMAANMQVWKFDVTHSNQTDYLKYDVEGHYHAHVDTFMNPNSSECRKLTVLVFLNDDFEGGKLFLQNGHEKIYPPQNAGTCLVFPSFIVHGVEPVTKGIRRSIVTWMVGPWFK